MEHQRSPCRLRNTLTTSTLAAVLFFLVAAHVVSNTDQAASVIPTLSVVRVIRVDVPPVVRFFDAKPEPGGSTVPLLLGCTYALEGGENDDENGGDATVAPHPTNATHGGGLHGRRSSPPPVLAMDAAMEAVQQQRGLVVKWYFRRNPVPAGGADDAMASINDNEQVYQWLAGGGPEAGGGLGPLSGRVVDVTAETPRLDKTVLHRVIRVERPTAELTGEYRCQVEDWTAERRSIWHPMVVYTPERIFKVTVDDNDDDDEDDIAAAEGSGGDGNFTSPAPSTSTTTTGAPLTTPKKWPTEINITCYAAGMHPEPSMSIWVNGVQQDSVTVTVMDDDGDDDETNDDEHNGSTTTTTTTTTAKPKVAYRSRHRASVEYKTYAIRAEKVVSLKDAEQYRHDGDGGKQRRRNNMVDVECRLRVPGEQTHWKLDRYYGARRSVAYKYRPDQTPQSDAFAVAPSASSVAEDDDDDGNDNDDALEATSGATRPSSYIHSIVHSAIVVVGIVIAVATAAQQ